jgi:hypothetical protein
MEGNGCSLKNGTEAFVVLFLSGAQLVLRSSVVTVLDLEVDVTLKCAKIFGSMRSR